MEFRCAAEVRIRWTLTVLNSTSVTFGLIQMALGLLINQSLPTDRKTTPPPPLWTTGIVTMFIGASGLSSFGFRPASHQLLIVMWMSLAVVLEVTGYIIFSVYGFFNPSNFSVTLHVFADCFTKSPPPSLPQASAAHRHVTAICACHNRDEDGDVVRALYVIGDSGCDVIRRMTILYMCYIVVFIISLLVLLTAILLAGLLVCCLRRCVVKGSHEGLRATIYGASVGPDPISSEAAATQTSFTWHRFKSSVTSLDGDAGRSSAEALQTASTEQSLRPDEGNS